VPALKQSNRQQKNKIGGDSMHGDYGWGMGLGFGWLFMILFWILVILGIVFLIKLMAGVSKSDRREDSALDILKKRYAKGEISKEEFEEKKKELL